MFGIVAFLDIFVFLAVIEFLVFSGIGLHFLYLFLYVFLQLWHFGYFLCLCVYYYYFFKYTEIQITKNTKIATKVITKYFLASLINIIVFF